MTLRYASVCSGIESASVAWAPLGWRAAFFAEIEKFPSAVLAHRFARVENRGDMTKFKGWPDETVDVLVGGTPCQSFSVAGLRKGLADPRGNLALTYLGVADKYRPRWLVWENVPGVRSSGGGLDFGSFLGGLGQLGYGWAYRSLDAQYSDLAQRRERLFVVAYLGDWRRAAEVLFERESLQGHTPACVAARKAAARRPARAPGGGRLWRQIAEAFGAGRAVAGGRAVAHPLLARANSSHDHTFETFVTHALTGEGFDASEDGTGRRTPLVAAPLGANKDGGWRGDLDNDTYVPVAFDTTQITSDKNYSHPKPGDPCHPLAAAAHPPAIAIQERAVCENPDAGPDGAGWRGDGAAYTLEARSVPQAVAAAMAVRRLTPVECERLQGFPDNFTRIPYRGKPAELCPDGPRYKALGNAMAVPVMRWIGERIDASETIAEGGGS